MTVSLVTICISGFVTWEILVVAHLSRYFYPFDMKSSLIIFTHSDMNPDINISSQEYSGLLALLFQNAFPDQTIINDPCMASTSAHSSEWLDWRSYYDISLFLVHKRIHEKHEFFWESFSYCLCSSLSWCNQQAQLSSIFNSSTYKRWKGLSTFDCQ